MGDLTDHEHFVINFTMKDDDSMLEDYVMPEDSFITFQSKKIHQSHKVEIKDKKTNQVLE